MFIRRFSRRARELLEIQMASSLFELFSSIIHNLKPNRKYIRQSIGLYGCLWDKPSCENQYIFLILAKDLTKRLIFVRNVFFSINEITSYIKKNQFNSIIMGLRKILIRLKRIQPISQWMKIHSVGNQLAAAQSDQQPYNNNIL